MLRLNASRILVSDTPLAGTMVKDYMKRKSEVMNWISVHPSLPEIRSFRSRRAQHPVDRKILHEALIDQYAGLELRNEPVHDSVRSNIDALLQQKTFTVTTGHQLQVAGGPLFFTYKILSIVRLARELNDLDRDFHHVPVFWMATEDHDMEEVRSFRAIGKTYSWDTSWSGAAGRASTDGMDLLLSELSSELKNLPYGPEIAGILEASYRSGELLSMSTRILVNRLFGRFGVVVLDADHPSLKRSAIPVFNDELLHRSAEAKVNETIGKQSAYGEPQVRPRPVNLFYLTETERNRIEAAPEGFKLTDTDRHFSFEEMTRLLHSHPERFSPNVLLRPVYQELILPNLAYVGGPSEVAYWLELKSLFDHHGVSFPAILLRNCFLFLDRPTMRRIEKQGWEDRYLLEDHASWVRDAIRRAASANDPFPVADSKVELIFKELQEVLTATDPTLSASVQAELQKTRKGLQHLQEKFLRAVKRGEEATLEQLQRLDEAVRPGGSFQERSESLVTFYARYGEEFIDAVLENCIPANDSLTILRDTVPKD
jgi:bacillithiol biosynthesis cysteine-adding enzyme BshC